MPTPEQIAQWFDAHPAGTNRECADALGIVAADPGRFIRKARASAREARAAAVPSGAAAGQETRPSHGIPGAAVAPPVVVDAAVVRLAAAPPRVEAAAFFDDTLLDAIVAGEERREQARRPAQARGEARRWRAWGAGLLRHLEALLFVLATFAVVVVAAAFRLVVWLVVRARGDRDAVSSWGPVFGVFVFAAAAVAVVIWLS